MSVRHCEVCGVRAACVDSRPRPEGWRRRYHCKCGNKWSTLEVPAKVRTPEPDKGLKRALIPDYMEPIKNKRDLIQRIAELRAKGHTILEIAAAVGRKRSSIELYCKTYKIPKFRLTKCVDPERALGQHAG